MRNFTGVLPRKQRFVNTVTNVIVTNLKDTVMRFEKALISTDMIAKVFQMYPENFTFQLFVIW